MTTTVSALSLVDTAAVVAAPTNGMATRRIAANAVAEKLFAAEAALDAALAAVASLTAAMPQATIDANLGAHVGHEAIMHAMESAQLLVKSRTNIIRTHKALLSAQHDMGLTEVAFGDMSKCPDVAELKPAEEAPARRLAAVA
jgi:hypothetical protein